MAGRTLPGIGLTGFWALGENGWKDANDANLLKLSVLTQAAILAVVAAVPGSPVEGDVVLLDAAHGTHPNEIAVYDAAAWTYYAPEEGWLVWDNDEGHYLSFQDGAWEVLTTGGGGGGVTVPDPSYGSPGDVLTVNEYGEYELAPPTGGGGSGSLLRFGSFITDPPLADEVLLAYVFAGDRTIPTDLDGSWLVPIPGLGVNPTASWEASIQVEGVEIGTMAVSTGGAVVFTVDETEVLDGQTLTIIGPNPADDTFANWAFTLKTSGAAEGGGGSSFGAPTIVQTEDSRTTGSGVQTLVFGSTPTVGNIILIMQSGSGWSNLALPPGFTVLGWRKPQPGENSTGDADYRVYGIQYQGMVIAYKRYSSADANSFAFPALLSDTNTPRNIVMYELADCDFLEAQFSFAESVDGSDDFWFTMPLFRDQGTLKIVMIEQDAGMDMAFVDPSFTQDYLMNSNVGSGNHTGLAGNTTADLDFIQVSNASTPGFIKGICGVVNCCKRV
jgi:hypothetical protein